MYLPRLHPSYTTAISDHEKRNQNRFSTSEAAHDDVQIVNLVHNPQSYNYPDLQLVHNPRTYIHSNSSFSRRDAPPFKPGPSPLCDDTLPSSGDPTPGYRLARMAPMLYARGKYPTSEEKTQESSLLSTKVSNPGG